MIVRCRPKSFLFCRRRARVARATLACVITLIGSKASLGQSIDFFFPQGTFGYDQQLGVTVQTRAHPLYEPLGIKVGSFTVQPAADQSLFYNSNVNGVAGSGSWGSRTAGSTSVNSDWARNSLGASVSFDHYQYLSLPAESYTNWNIGLAGGYTIGDNQLLGAYSHQTFYQLATTIATVRTETPELTDTDSAALEYTFNFGRLSVTPNIAASAYRFGPITSQGLTFSQDFLNRDAFAAGATTRYALNEQSALVAVIRGLNSTYLTRQAGQPSNDSNSLLLLGGIDYQAKGVWRYRVLAGVEVRKFSASQYPVRTAPDVEGSVIWSPTSLTTLDLSFSSAIQSPQTTGTSGYVLMQGRLAIDHEYRRNILLQGHGQVQKAQYLQNGSQTQLNAGGGVTWLLNRSVRVSLDYDYTTQTGGGSSTVTTTNIQTQTINQFTESLIALTVHLAL